MIPPSNSQSSSNARYERVKEKARAKAKRPLAATAKFVVGALLTLKVAISLIVFIIALSFFRTLFPENCGDTTECTFATGNPDVCEILILANNPFRGANLARRGNEALGTHLWDNKELCGLWLDYGTGTATDGSEFVLRAANQSLARITIESPLNGAALPGLKEHTNTKPGDAKQLGTPLALTGCHMPFWGEGQVKYEFTDATAIRKFFELAMYLWLFTRAIDCMLTWFDLRLLVLPTLETLDEMSEASVDNNKVTLELADFGERVLQKSRDRFDWTRPTCFWFLLRCTKYFWLTLVGYNFLSVVKTVSWDEAQLGPNCPAIFTFSSQLQVLTFGVIIYPLSFLLVSPFLCCACLRKWHKHRRYNNSNDTNNNNARNNTLTMETPQESDDGSESGAESVSDMDISEAENATTVPDQPGVPNKDYGRCTKVVANLFWGILLGFGLTFWVVDKLRTVGYFSMQNVVDYFDMMPPDYISAEFIVFLVMLRLLVFVDVLDGAVNVWMQVLWRSGRNVRWCSCFCRCLGGCCSCFIPNGLQEVLGLEKKTGVSATTAALEKEEEVFEMASLILRDQKEEEPLLPAHINGGVQTIAPSTAALPFTNLPNTQAPAFNSNLQFFPSAGPVPLSAASPATSTTYPTNMVSMPVPMYSANNVAYSG